MKEAVRIISWGSGVTISGILFNIIGYWDYAQVLIPIGIALIAYGYAKVIDENNKFN